MENLMNLWNEFFSLWKNHFHLIILGIIILITIAILVINFFTKKELWVFYKIRKYNYIDVVKQLKMNYNNSEQFQKLILEEVELRVKFLLYYPGYTNISINKIILSYYIDNIIASLPNSSEKFKKKLEAYKKNDYDKRLLSSFYAYGNYYSQNFLQDIGIKPKNVVLDAYVKRYLHNKCLSNWANFENFENLDRLDFILNSRLVKKLFLIFILFSLDSMDALFELASNTFNNLLSMVFNGIASIFLVILFAILFFLSKFFFYKYYE